MDWYWSWLLTLWGVSGMYLAGKRSQWGWVLNLTLQIGWGYFAIKTAQYGFAAGSVFYGAVYLKNFLAWRKEDQCRTSAG